MKRRKKTKRISRSSNTSWFVRIRSVFFIVLFSLLIFAIYIPVKYGIANVEYYKADHALISWHKSADNLSAKSWQYALKSITHANNLHPSHPLYLDIKGKILLWGASLDAQELKSTDIGIGREELLSLALASFKQSLQIRPVWANTWIDFAMTKWNLNQIDDEFWTAVANAEKYGPYMPEVNLGLASIYMAFWPQLNGIQKANTLEQIKRTLLQVNNIDYSFNYRTELIERVKIYKKENVFCTLIKLDKTLKHFKR
jgi:hypothetical protein